MKMHPESLTINNATLLQLGTFYKARFCIYKARFYKVSSAILLCLLLSHCASNINPSSTPVEVRDISVDRTFSQPSVIQDTATPLNSQPNYNIERAEYYTQLANSQTNSTTQTNSRLSAGEYYIQANDYRQAQQAIAVINASNLDQQQYNRYRIIQAYIDYSAGSYQAALDKLSDLLIDQQSTGESQDISIENQTQRVDALLLSSFCYQQLNDYESAISVLLERESLLTGNARAETTRYIWQVINTLNSNSRQQIIGQTNDVLLRNRLEQSLSGEFALQTEVRPSQFDQWRQSAVLDNKEVVNTNWDANSPKRIAVLLPINSRFSTAAQAVQDGIEYQHDNNSSIYKPQIDFYDIGADPNQAGQYYSSISQKGYDMVIGPIGKDYANQLYLTANRQSQNSLFSGGTPTILLGGDINLSQQPNTNFSRLTFSPEADGIEVANRAKRQGYVNAAIIHPLDENSQRTANAFQRHWLNQGGNISKAITYSPNQFDHSVELKQLFEINQSEYRHRQISNVLSFKPEFAPYRRSDVDFIFMIANNDSGRIVRPQINFFRSNTVPVYSASGVFNGIQDKTNNLDLEETRFPVIPWVLQSTEISPYAGQLNLLFAMGGDAYQVAANYRAMRNNSSTAINGKMGALHIEPSGEIVFQPVWAEFKNGLAETSTELPVLRQAISRTPNQRSTGSSQPTQNGSNSYDDSNWDTRESSRKTGTQLP